MTRGLGKTRSAAVLRAALGGLALVLAGPPAPPAYALRANMVQNVQRLEEMGHYEQALFYRRSSMDMVMALHVAFAGAPFDPQMDGVYRQLDAIYGSGRTTQHQLVETRVDRRYWGIVNNQKRAVSQILAKASLSAEQLERLDDRVRVYVEDHLAPEFDEMGNFFFRRKAWIFERTGLFWDASFRRRLTGTYAMRVCVPYYATMSAELARQGRRPEAEAYGAKSAWYREEAVREFRRSNGDRLLAELQAGNRRQRFTREQVVELLKAGLGSEASDARFAAVLNLADLGQIEALRPAARDADPEIRRIASALLEAPAPPPGLKPGIRVEYFSSPEQKAPLAQKVLRAVDLGFQGNERFPDILRAHWEKETIFPANATGQFLLKFRGRIAIAKDGRHRFYVRTEAGNRATVRLADASGRLATIISPRNDKKLLYADQANWGGGTIHRIDFSMPLDLKEGMADIEIDYQGDKAHSQYGKAGIRLYWSSDRHVMELVPARVLFHKAD